MLTAFWQRKRGIIENYFKTAFAPRVLIVTLNRPFLKGLHLKHNNVTEAMEMAKVFHELGYQVDIINHDNTMTVDYDRYAVLFGAGAALDRLFQVGQARLPKTIIYSCGAYVPLSNRKSLQRLQAVYRRRGVWLAGSARVGAGGIGAESVVDGLLVLGNHITADPFRALTDKPVLELPLFFLRVQDAAEVLRARDLAQARRHFMWFAGTGLVHKGLDLVLEAFLRHPELHLHVYGAIENEQPFVRAFHRELHQQPNIHVEGFLPLQSPQFRAALEKTAFVICPSCSEASCSSVVNVCGNGGNIPVLTRECAIDLQDFGVLIGATTVEAVEAALVEASGFDQAELERRLHACAAFFGTQHSMANFHRRLKEGIQAILAGPGPAR